MIDVGAINRALENCPCGRPHRIDFRALEISRGNTADSGRILRDASFPKRLHAVYDGNTVRAAAGVLDAIAEAGFIISHTSYENLTVAAAEEAQRVKSDLLANRAEGIVSTGSVRLRLSGSWSWSAPAAVIAGSAWSAPIWVLTRIRCSEFSTAAAFPPTGPAQRIF